MADSAANILFSFLLLLILGVRHAECRVHWCSAKQAGLPFDSARPPEKNAIKTFVVARLKTAVPIMNYAFFLKLIFGLDTAELESCLAKCAT